MSNIPYVPVSLKDLPPPPRPPRIGEGDPGYDEAYEKRTKRTAGIIQEILAASGGPEGLEKELRQWAESVPSTYRKHHIADSIELEAMWYPTKVDRYFNKWPICTHRRFPSVKDVYNHTLSEDCPDREYYHSMEQVHQEIRCRRRGQASWVGNEETGDLKIFQQGDTLSMEEMIEVVEMQLDPANTELPDAVRWIWTETIAEMRAALESDKLGNE